MPDRPRHRLPRIAVALALLAGAAAGCTLAPRKFAHVDNPAPLVRARALTLGDTVPDAQAVPVLLQSLDDPDHVVRMTANEELKRRTGQDFGFQPWADPQQRLLARRRWHSWFYGPPRAQPSPQVPADVGAPPPAPGGLPR